MTSVLAWLLAAYYGKALKGPAALLLYDEVRKTLTAQLEVAAAVLALALLACGLYNLLFAGKARAHDD
jgi:hypothetical protein